MADQTGNGPDSPRAKAPSAGFASELRDSVEPRTVWLIVGVLFVQLAFVFSYVGAFHAPKPHSVPVMVVAPEPIARRLAVRLNASPGSPLKVTVAPSRAAAVTRIKAAEQSAALVVAPASHTDQLLVASGGGAAVVTAVEKVARDAENAQGRQFTVTDVVPLQPGDARGLTGFYLVIGWIVGGYLVAAMLGIARGSRPANTARAAIRLGALALYAIASGIGGALIVGPLLGALTGHFIELAALGALIVYAAGAVTMTFQVLAGVVGIGLTVLLFVVLGNPSAGGAYQQSLLPGFWRTLSNALPNGAGTDSVRRIVYFSGQGIGGHLAVIGAYAVIGTVAALGVSAFRSADRGRAAPESA